MFARLAEQPRSSVTLGRHRRLEPVTLELRSEQILSLSRHSSVTLHCLAGSLWLTFDGKGDDIILQPGDFYEIPSGSSAVIFAFTPARLTIRQG